jgi:hypothetical protein
MRENIEIGLQFLFFPLTHPEGCFRILRHNYLKHSRKREAITIQYRLRRAREAIAN